MSEPESPIDTIDEWWSRFWDACPLNVEDDDALTYLCYVVRLIVDCGADVSKVDTFGDQARMRVDMQAIQNAIHYANQGQP
jgi:hypothetical protein